MTSERMMRRAETQVALRKGLMLANALAYICWIGSLGFAHSGMFDLDQGVWEAVRFISMPLWAASLMLICVQLVVLKRDRALAVLIYDERSAQNRYLAYKVGYWALLLAVSLAYVASFGLDLDVATVLPLLLAIGVTAPIFATTFFGAD